MTFYNTRPADGRDCADVDNDIRGNFVAIQKGEHFTAASEPSYKQQGTPWYDSGNDVVKFYTGSAWKVCAWGQSGGTLFGSWASKSNNTSYEAASDGIVCAFSNAGNTKVVQGYTDASNPPTTERIANKFNNASATGFAGITMPVKKGDYWKVTGAATVYWIPLGV